MASNACGSEGFPAHVTNSISPQSHRTSRLWRCMASDHPLHPRPRLPRESLKDQADRQSQNRLILPSVIKPTTNQNDDIFDSIDPSPHANGSRLQPEVDMAPASYYS